MTEGETARFVLAYLLSNNYSKTATAFLQECNELPSKTLLVLPETSLQVIIAAHKSRNDTKILVNTLGADSAWKALWSKLDHTLQQLKTMFEDKLSGHLPQHGPQPSTQNVRSRPTRYAPRNVSHKQSNPPTSQPHMSGTLPPPASHPHTHSSTLPPPGSQPHTHGTQAHPHSAVQSHSSVPPPHFTAGSPRKRKFTVPKKIPLSLSPSTSHPPEVLPAPPLSPSLQHALDSLMEDNELPKKLADIINRCVLKEDTHSEDASLGLSTSTLDDCILNLTSTDPILEGLLSHMANSRDHTDTLTDGIFSTSPTTKDEDEIFPPRKKHRLEDSSGSSKDRTASLTEQDIDSFLDKLHNS